MNNLKNINDKTLDSLLAISLSWFFILFLANLIFTKAIPPPLDILLLFVIIINAILTYKLCYNWFP